ncbi:MAG: protein phosphatase 2C domain-containing protein, partial [Myxococcales bacterium]
DGAMHLESPEALAEPGEALVREAGSIAPPEIADAGKASFADDQYALGVLSWALITARKPYDRGGLPLPRVFAPALPHGVTSVLMRATQQDPKRRFESVRAFAQALKSRTAPRGRSARSFKAAAATEIGRLKKLQMPVNQDAFYVGLDEKSGRGMLLVADGVSTADVGSGDLAANFVRDAVKGAWEGAVGDILRGHGGPMPEDWLKAALEAILDDANARIFAYLKQPIFVGSLGPSVHPPCSTAVLAILDGDRLTVANVGDSRVYLLRDGVLEQMSVDQDLRTELLKAGRDPAGVGDPGALGALTQSVGRLSFDEEGSISLRSVKPDVQTLWLRAGDRVLICSDGVPDCLGQDAEEIMARELARGDDPQAIAAALCRLADEALGGDNITPLVLLAS